MSYQYLAFIESIIEDKVIIIVNVNGINRTLVRPINMFSFTCYINMDLIVWTENGNLKIDIPEKELTRHSKDVIKNL